VFYSETHYILIFIVANLSFLPIKQGIIFDISFGMIVSIFSFGLMMQIGWIFTDEFIETGPAISIPFFKGAQVGGVFLSSTKSLRSKPEHK
jgi:hypothetical protein